MISRLFWEVMELEINELRIIVFGTKSAIWSSNKFTLLSLVSGDPALNIRTASDLSVSESGSIRFTSLRVS